MIERKKPVGPHDNRKLEVMAAARKRATRAELRARPVEFTPSYHQNLEVVECPSCGPAIDALSVDGIAPDSALPDCDDCGNVRLVYVQREKST